MIKVADLNIKLGSFNLSDLNFTVYKGEYFMLLGESGAGKSVILECIAGIIPPAKGKITLNNINITKLSIQKRQVGLVFQDFALFPNYSVYDNIAYPLKIKKESRENIATRIKELAELMEINHLLQRNPQTLSGGEKQRVALARTLTLEPDILLLDEPLSAIDISLKGELRSLLRKINLNGQTIIHVTHDYEEAISLAHRIAIIQNGKQVQIGTPQEVFQNPCNRFVANFGGIKNFYATSVEKVNKGEYSIANITPQVQFKLLTMHKAQSGHVLIGQKNISLSQQNTAEGDKNTFVGIIKEIVPARFGFEIVIDAGIRFYVAITSEEQHKMNYVTNQSIWLSFNVSAVRFIPG